MNKRASFAHYPFCSVGDIGARSSPDRAHRFNLRVPFSDRPARGALGIIGQNPSMADEQSADRTIRFLEQYVHAHLPQYGQLVFLNLYSRIDTNCVETEGLLHPDSDRILEESLKDCTEVLLVFGRLSNGSAYRFLDRARQLSPLLESKRLFKFDVDVAYAAHPGNPKILYNTKFGLVRCNTMGESIAP